MRGDIAVIGWYDNDNVGDETYKVALPMLFSGRTFHFGQTYGSGQYQTCILGGGNVASASFTKQWLRHKGRKLVLSISVLPNDDINSLRYADEIFVRDHNSVRLLQNVGIAASYLPDLAFCLQPDFEAGKQLLQQIFCQTGHDLYTRCVAVVFNSYLLGRENWLSRDHLTFEYIVSRLAAVIDATNASFVFIPFGSKAPTDDRVSNAWLATRCKWFKKNAIVYQGLSPQQALNLISACNAVISTRLHASIFSVIAGKPFIDLTHHDKNMQFLKSIYREDWSVPYWRFDSSKVESLLTDFLNNGNHAIAEVAMHCQQLLQGMDKTCLD